MNMNNGKYANTFIPFSGLKENHHQAIVFEQSLFLYVKKV